MSDTGASAPEPLESAVARLLPLLAELEAVLERELGALREGDTRILAGEIERQQGLMRRIDQQLQCAPLAEALASPPEPAPPSWPQMLSQLRRCRSLNETVGGALITAMRHNEQLLRVLGHLPETDLYGRGGHAAPPASGRTLATA